MTGMTSLTDHLFAHAVGREEFEALRDGRDDGNRYELLGGEVLVTPAPAPQHQVVSVALTVLLAPLAGPHQRLLTAPVDVLLPTVAQDTVLQPDLVLTGRADLTSKAVEGVPLLVVEILSPTTWRRDLGIKRDVYAAAGVPHYWVVSPAIPSLTVYRLADDGGYAELHHVTGDGVARVDEPFRLDVRPSDLLR